MISLCLLIGSQEGPFKNTPSEPRALKSIQVLLKAIKGHEGLLKHYFEGGFVTAPCWDQMILMVRHHLKKR